MKMTPYFRNLLLAIPLIFLTIIPFILLGSLLDVNLKIQLIALGALGWWIALLLRIPVMLIARRLGEDSGRKFVILSSGPAEEITRLAILLVIGLTIEHGYLIGLGWASIEIVYSIVQGIGMGVLQQKTDKKAQEAKQMMSAMGMDKAMEPEAPFWGVIERVSASAMHLSFSLLLVISPLMIVLTAPLHSFMNILITKLIKRSIAMAEISLFTLSAVIFVVTVILSL